jgi:hypothetical protein
MRLRQNHRLWLESLPGRSVLRWIVVAVGLGVLVVALACAAEPYRQTREFRAVVACERQAAGCFDHEPGTIVGKRTYTTTSTTTSPDGATTTTFIPHYEVTWQRADGSREARDVPSSFYDATREGQPADLRLWRGQVVWLEVDGVAERFLPEPGTSLGYWLYLAVFGFGVLMSGLLAGWDGFVPLVLRTAAWMIMSFLPVSLTTHALAYGWELDFSFVVTVVVSIAVVALAVRMLVDL